MKMEGCPQMNLKIKLRSDFNDYYDHAFASNAFPADYVFNRMSTNEIDRGEQFCVMDTTFRGNRISVVEHALAKDYFGLYRELVVVYLDPLAHRGENKLITTIEDARDRFPDCLCSKYWGRKPMVAESMRHLQIGDQAWQIDYTGYGSWMSNNAPVVDIKVVGSIPPFNQVGAGKYYAMFAIDFVNGTAIDFNTSPGLKGAGMENKIKPDHIYQLITDFVEIYGAEKVYGLDKI